MSKPLVHTPEGVRDIYGEEYLRKLMVEEKLHHSLRSYGYQDIQTPTFEFFDVFSREIGTTPSRELYKFFDKEGEYACPPAGFHAFHGEMCRQIFYG